jgi:hypothetical protein
MPDEVVKTVGSELPPPRNGVAKEGKEERT